MLLSGLSIVRRAGSYKELSPLLPKVKRVVPCRNKWNCAVIELEIQSAVELLCPICLTTEINRDKLSCDRCSRTFDSNDNFVDLTLTSGLKSSSYDTQRRRNIFQSPFVGFVYERGWRQGFASSGFPGPDKEFDTAINYLAPVVGDAVMDLSCGSGLFTRRFLSCGLFKEVIAVDYSEAMLTQTQQYVARMKTPLRAKLSLIRADVARLPFQTGSFKAIYSGAAIHCWPNPEQALAEISRVLTPGGIFVFSTFTRLPRELENLLNRPLLRPFQTFRSSRVGQTGYWLEKELKGVTELVGLEGFETIRNRLYLMASVNKPLNINN